MRKTDVVALLAELLRYTGSSIHGAAFASSNQLQSLVDLGILVPDGHVPEVLCSECGDIHPASVVQTDRGLLGICSRIGSEFEIECDIAAFHVRSEPLIDLLTNCMETERRWAKPRHHSVFWSIGSFLFLDYRVGVYFLLGAADLERFCEIRAWLKDEPRNDGMAVVTNDTRDIGQLHLPQPGRVVSLVDCIRLDGQGRLILDREWLARRVLPEGILAAPRAGRPPIKKELAAKLIAELDRDGALRKLPSENARHEALLNAAKARNGDHATLSKEPCKKAWAAYIAARARGQ